MTTRDLQNIILSGENEQTEFKSSFGNEVIETLSAFANTKGGIVIVGLNDQANIRGLEIGKETIQNWINEIKQKTSPSIVPDIIIHQINNNNLILFEINEFPIKHVSFKGKFFKRLQNSNHQMSISDIANLHLKTMNSSWDYYADSEHTIDSLSEEKIYSFIEKIGLDANLLEFLKKFELIKNEKITFGANLLFSSIPSLLTTI